MLSNWNDNALKTAVQASATSITNGETYPLPLQQRVELTKPSTALSTLSSEVESELRVAGSRSNADFTNAINYFADIFKFAIDDISGATFQAVNIEGDPESELGMGSVAEAKLQIENAEGMSFACLCRV